MVHELLFPDNPFLRAVALVAITVSVTDPIMFYVLWIGKAQLTPLFVIAVIIITVVAITLNLWFRVFRGVENGQ